MLVAATYCCSQSVYVTIIVVKVPLVQMKASVSRVEENLFLLLLFEKEEARLF